MRCTLGSWSWFSGAASSAVAVLVVVLSACSSFGTSSTPSAPDDGGPGADAATDVTTDGAPTLDGAPTPEGGPVADCSYKVPLTMKTCAGAADCVIEEHWSDACGSVTMVGVSAAQAPAFTTLESQQRANATSHVCACTGTKKANPSCEDGQPFDTTRAGVVKCQGTQCLTVAN